MPTHPQASGDDGVERQSKAADRSGYSYDVNLLPDYSRLTPFLKRYIDSMGGRTLTGSKT